MIGLTFTPTALEPQKKTVQEETVIDYMSKDHEALCAEIQRILKITITSGAGIVTQIQTLALKDVLDLKLKSGSIHATKYKLFLDRLNFLLVSRGLLFSGLSGSEKTEKKEDPKSLSIPGGQ